MYNQEKMEEIIRRNKSDVPKMDLEALRRLVIPELAYEPHKKRKRDSCIKCEISKGNMLQVQKDLADRKYYILDLCSKCESESQSNYLPTGRELLNKKNFKIIELSYAREQREFLEKYFFKYGVEESELRIYCHSITFREFISDIDDAFRQLRNGFYLGLNPKPEEYAKYFFEKYPQEFPQRIGRFRTWIHALSNHITILSRYDFLEKFFYRHGIKEEEIRTFCENSKMSFEDFILRHKYLYDTLQHGCFYGTNPTPENYAIFFFQKVSVRLEDFYPWLVSHLKMLDDLWWKKAFENSKEPTSIVIEDEYETTERKRKKTKISDKSDVDLENTVVQETINYLLDVIVKDDFLDKNDEKNTKFIRRRRTIQYKRRRRKWGVKRTCPKRACKDKLKLTKKESIYYSLTKRYFLRNLRVILERVDATYENLRLQDSTREDQVPEEPQYLESDSHVTGLQSFMRTKSVNKEIIKGNTLENFYAYASDKTDFECDSNINQDKQYSDEVSDISDFNFSDGDDCAKDKDLQQLKLEDMPIFQKKSTVDDSDMLFRNKRKYYTKYFVDAYLPDVNSDESDNQITTYEIQNEDTSRSDSFIAQEELSMENVTILDFNDSEPDFEAFNRMWEKITKNNRKILSIENDDTISDLGNRPEANFGQFWPDSFIAQDELSKENDEIISELVNSEPDFETFKRLWEKIEKNKQKKLGVESNNTVSYLGNSRLDFETFRSNWKKEIKNIPKPRYPKHCTENTILDWLYSALKI